MQVSVSNIIIIITVLTVISLIMVSALLAFVVVYNKKKRNHFAEKATLQRSFNEQMLQSQLEIQEITFRNLSSEIHDNVGQLLSLAAVQLSIWENDPEKVQTADIKENVSIAMNELRYLARNINGEHLKKISLKAFLDSQCEKINKSGIVRCRVDAAAGILLPEEQKIILFRMIQECIQNSLRHAAASLLRLSARITAEQALSITIRDDGKGFDREAPTIKTQNGLGLKTMEHRIALLKGVFDLKSEPGRGTLITLTIPYERSIHQNCDSG